MDIMLPNPTGAIYGVYPTSETHAEEMPGIDLASLMGPQREVIEHTPVSPQHLHLVAPSFSCKSAFDAAKLMPDPSFLMNEDTTEALQRTCLIACGFSSESALRRIAPTAWSSLVYFKVSFPTLTSATMEWPQPASATIAQEPTHAPPAYDAFKDLGRWLDADDGAIAKMVGVGRTTPYTWKRDCREPRAATVRRIYEYHATIDSLRRRLATSDFRRWLNEGVSSRRDRLLSGELESLEMDVHAVLFRREPNRRVDLAAAPEEPPRTTAVHRDRPLRPSGRSPRRSRK